MNRLKLQAELRLRSRSRSRSARRLRRDGRVPAVVYGGTEPETISVDARDLQVLFRHVSESTIISLSMSGTDRDVLIKDYQTDRIADKLVHVDFLEVIADRMLRTHVPLSFSGTPAGVREGGILETLVREVHVECLPSALPGQIEVDISALGSGQSIHIHELEVADGVRVLNAPDQVACLVAHRVAEEEEEAVDEIEAEAETDEELGEEEAAEA